MAKKQIDLGLTGLDELFMDDRERAESKLPKVSFPSPSHSPLYCITSCTS